MNATIMNVNNKKLVNQQNNKTTVQSTNPYNTDDSSVMAKSMEIADESAQLDMSIAELDSNESDTLNKIASMISDFISFLNVVQKIFTSVQTFDASHNSKDAATISNHDYVWGKDWQGTDNWDGSLDDHTFNPDIIGHNDQDGGTVLVTPSVIPQSLMSCFESMNGGVAINPSSMKSALNKISGLMSGVLTTNSPISEQFSVSSIEDQQELTPMIKAFQDNESQVTSKTGNIANDIAELTKKLDMVWQTIMANVSKFCSPENS
jgi:hypothetical protein